MKLEKLSEEQELLIPVVGDFWKNRLLSCNNQTKIDKIKCEEGIKFIYELSGKKTPKQIIYAPSPKACQTAANELCGTKKVFYDFSVYGNIGDYGWVALYDYFTRIGVINHEKFNRFKEFILSGLYDMIVFDEAVIICEM